MPRGGRYRYTPIALWGSPDYLKLSSNARLTLFALRTGTFSNLPGLFKYFNEVLMLETGLALNELDAALSELEKRSFIVRDGFNIVWVRRQLEEDPACEKLNEWHHKGIRTVLGGLPKESPVVRKFRRYYDTLIKQTRTQAPTQTPTQAAPKAHWGVPEERKTEDRQSSTPATSTPGDREREGKNLWSTSLTESVPVQSLEPVSNGSHNGQRVRLQDAPAEWFNDCGEGRQRRCVKLPFLDRVDGQQCYSHEAERRKLTARLARTAVNR